jgi:DNA-binding transcriptional ArsR family regulator
MALVHKQPQCVSSLAELTGLSLPMTSMYLRAMEARGLLSARRTHRVVEYRLPAMTPDNPRTDLILALQNKAKTEEKAVSKIFQLATGFTHPTRVEIYRRLAGEPAGTSALASALRGSYPALMRHLQKLVRRGYLVRRGKRYEAIRHADGVGRALAALASQG